ncbi:hypothetical protein VTK73DRAFT_9425 [Phialemonium thermophilum]|uniref:Uncharacterized protein n=1 Tax=Phialemonium thermophilum TaxID=223376 RepID=A0ABR3W2P1_9PEZI
MARDASTSHGRRSYNICSPGTERKPLTRFGVGVYITSFQHGSGESRLSSIRCFRFATPWPRLRLLNSSWSADPRSVAHVRALAASHALQSREYDVSGVPGWCGVGQLNVSVAAFSLPLPSPQEAERALADVSSVLVCRSESASVRPFDGNG